MIKKLLIIMGCLFTSQVEAASAAPKPKTASTTTGTTALKRTASSPALLGTAASASKATSGTTRVSKSGAAEWADWQNSHIAAMTKTYDQLNPYFTQLLNDQYAKEDFPPEQLDSLQATLSGYADNIEDLANFTKNKPEGKFKGRSGDVTKAAGLRIKGAPGYAEAMKKMQELKVQLEKVAEKFGLTINPIEFDGDKLAAAATSAAAAKKAAAALKRPLADKKAATTAAAKPTQPASSSAFDTDEDNVLGDLFSEPKSTAPAKKPAATDPYLAEADATLPLDGPVARPSKSGTAVAPVKKNPLDDVKATTAPKPKAAATRTSTPKTGTPSATTKKAPNKILALLNDL